MDTSNNFDLVLATNLSRVGIVTRPDDKVWKNKFEIRSETSNRIYVIAQKINDETWGCSCMGWKRYRRCKHLNSIKPMIDALKKQLQLQ